jgi:hypothetical protein
MRVLAGEGTGTPLSGDRGQHARRSSVDHLKHGLNGELDVIAVSALAALGISAVDVFAQRDFAEAAAESKRRTCNRVCRGIECGDGKCERVISGTDRSPSAIHRERDGSADCVDRWMNLRRHRSAGAATNTNCFCRGRRSGRGIRCGACDK